MTVQATCEPAHTPNIGVLGGHSLFEVGPATSLCAFFQAIQDSGFEGSPEAPASLITDRLRCRYIPTDHVPAARKALAALRHHLTQRGSTELDRALMHTLLTAVDQAAEAALSFRAEFGIDQPVRLVFAELPAFMIDKKRPLIDYDRLHGPPFWLRPLATSPA